MGPGSDRSSPCLSCKCLLIVVKSLSHALLGPSPPTSFSSFLEILSVQFPQRRAWQSRLASSDFFDLSTLHSNFESRLPLGWPPGSGLGSFLPLGLSCAWIFPLLWCFLIEWAWMGPWNWLIGRPFLYASPGRMWLSRASRCISKSLKICSSGLF